MVNEMDEFLFTRLETVILPKKQDLRTLLVFFNLFNPLFLF